MNKAITDGLVLMPTPFAAGLGQWSRGDGVPGSDTYHNIATAAFVPADQDFGGALEILKTEATQKLRYKGETPLLPGCYLRVTARVKAIAGSLPSVRVAGWAGKAGGGHVGGLTETGPSVQLTSYGEVVEISAIIGAGNRGGVDMVWGTEAIYGHFGIDLTGPTGGVVRVDDIEIEDVTGVFLRDIVNVVDVRDFGAVGNGSADDSAAFEAADAAANGRTVLVSKGTYRLANSVTMDSRVEFEGTVTMPRGAILSLRKNFGLPAYIDAFGDEEEALAKAIQSLLNNADHESLDMGGRRVTLRAPMDVQAMVPNRSSYAQRRVIRNGQIRAETNVDWSPRVVTSRATYSASKNFKLTNVVNVANVPVGALVEGAGVGREIYVRSVDIPNAEIELSQPIGDAEGTQVFTFTRFKFLLDFSGFNRLDVFQLNDLEFQCGEQASGILLAPVGIGMQVRDCVFNRPGHRAIASHGSGCQGMVVQGCQFISHEGGTLSQNRVSVAITANGQDIKIQDNRASQFRHFLVFSGAQGLISGNHFYQGDPASAGIRTAGIVLALKACNTTIADNYIDNAFIEWTNEREAQAEFTDGFGFAGLSVTGNIFLCSHVARWFSFLVVKPYGTGHFVNGLNVSGNTFRAVSGNIARVERVDDSFAPLDLTKMKKIDFSNNTYHAIDNGSSNPLTVSHSQNTHAETWVIGTESRLPFDGHAREVDTLVHRGRLRNEANVSEWYMPYTLTNQGGAKNQVHVIYPRKVRGDLNIQVRMD
ncbi:glycosyl hydrolase family 28-related protein [Litorisediminicola beolgyonensis]|uniref:Glycosyl hydrolase family 28-related protein n=1 Tax=Litorisediminicola beolgyonensis TaxID=1173614 RepID=A0ABW3ZNR9_9RHOB